MSRDGGGGRWRRDRGGCSRRGWPGPARRGRRAGVAAACQCLRVAAGAAWLPRGLSGYEAGRPQGRRAGYWRREWGQSLGLQSGSEKGRGDVGQREKGARFEALSDVSSLSLRLPISMRWPRAFGPPRVRHSTAESSALSPVVHAGCCTGVYLEVCRIFSRQKRQFCFERDEPGPEDSSRPEVGEKPTARKYK